MVHQFLYGLNETKFHTIRSSLTSRVPLPGLEEVYNIVRQEEDMLNNRVSKEERTDVTPFAVQMRSRSEANSEKFQNKKLCIHCNRGGHSPENCFVLIGYPEWWGDRPRGQPPSNGSTGRGRGRFGPGFSGGQPRPTYVNAVMTGPFPSAEHVNRVITDKDRDAVCGLTDEQWRGVVKLLNAGRSDNKSNAHETLSGPHYEDGDWDW